MAHQTERKREVTPGRSSVHVQRVREGDWRTPFHGLGAEVRAVDDESSWLPHFLPSATLLDESERDARRYEAGPTDSMKDSWTR